MRGRGDRVLLCRPAGGLNDMLCQIERCCRYAEAYGRRVVVETDHVHAVRFRDAFANYFVSRDKRLALDARDLRERLDRMDVYPAFLRGRVSSYRARHAGREERLVDVTTGLRPSFDFDRDYPQDLLVHHDYGGGRLSASALARMRLHPRLAAELERRRRSMPLRYTALHIRNTDYRACYLGRLEAIARDIDGVVFVATDNRASLDHCREAFGAARVASFANLSTPPGQPLHEMDTADGARERNDDAILDLLLLALADTIFTFQLEPNLVGARFSGFSLLALDLKDSPAVLQALTAAPRRWRLRLTGDLSSPIGPRSPAHNPRSP